MGRRTSRVQGRRPGTSLSSGTTPWRNPALVGLGVLLADQITKWWALDALSGGRIVGLAWTLQLRLVRNTGVAFSQGRGLGPVVALAVILVILFLIRMGANASDPIARTAVGGVVGGAIGNLIDRIVRSDAGPFDGAVVDFVDLGWWPVFNLADAAIVVGGVVIVGSGLVR